MGVFSLGGLPCSCCTTTPSCPVTVCAVDCNGSTIAGATVTIHVGGTTGDVTGTTGSVGCVTLDIGVAGSYSTTISASGYDTNSGIIAYTCNGTTTVTLFSPGSASVTFSVGGCFGPVIHPTVSCNGNTYTCDDTGFVAFNVPTAGTYSYTVSAPPRFNDATGSFTVTDPCFGPAVNVGLVIASGYACCPFNTGVCLPLPVTMHITDSQWGAGTLSYDSVSGNWLGVINVSFPGGCGCPAQSVAIHYTLGCSANTFSVMTAIAVGGGEGCPGNSGPSNQLSPAFSNTSVTCTSSGYSAVWGAVGCICSGTTCTGDTARFVWRLYPTAATITISE